MFRRVLMAAVLTLAVAASGLAQRPGGGGGFGGGGFGGAMGGGKSEAIKKELKLSKTQEPEVYGILDAAQKLATPVAAKIRETRIWYTQVAMGAQIGGKDVPEDPLKRMTQLEAELIKIEIDAYNQIVAKLDDKQKPRADKLFELMDGMFAADGGWRRSK